MAVPTGRELPFGIKAPACPTTSDLPVDAKGETSPLSNAQKPALERWTAAVRALRAAVRDGGSARTHEAVATWREKLTPAERHHAAIIALAAAEPGDVLDLLHSLAERTGVPLPAFADLRAEADAWAAFASKSELRAYAAAIGNRLRARAA